jgi:hypothetical protein
MRITKAEDAYIFASKIVTYKTKSPVYGNEKADILGDGTIFAWINNIATNWQHDDELGLTMHIFTKAHLSLSIQALTSSELKHADGLDMRLATIEK